MKLPWKKDKDKEEKISEGLKEEDIIRLAYQTKHEPERFINILENAFEKASDSNKVYEFVDIGIILYKRSFIALAIASWFLSVDYARRINDRTNESRGYANIGSAYDILGQYQKAIDFYERALDIAKDIGDRELESGCYVNIGRVYHSLGQYQKAMEYLEAALPILHEIGKREIEANCFGDIGMVYHSLGQYQKAIDFYERALDIAKDIGDRELESVRYVNIGMVCRRIGQYQKAIEYYEKALPILHEIGNRDGEAGLYVNIGNLCEDLGQYQKAIDFYERALASAKNMDNKARESICYANIGSAYDILGQYQKAMEYLEAALPISKDIGDIVGLRKIYRSLASIYRRNNLDKAFQYLTESINLSESMAGMLVEEVHKIWFQSSTASDYELIIPLCLKLQRDDKTRLAFEYVQRGKSRTLIDLMSANESILPAGPMTDKLKLLIDKENEHVARLRQIQTQHLRNEKVIVEPGEVDRLRKELEDIYTEIAKYDKQYVSLRKPQPISVDEIKARFENTGRNAVMVEYFVTQEKTYIFVVNHKELHVKEVELTREKLIQYADSYQREIVQYLDHGDIGDFSIQELSKYLIEPISEHLSNVSLLYFVPHGMLHYIPLHVLLLKGQAIIRYYPVVYTPSASLMQYFKTGKGHLDNSASFGVILKEDEHVFGEEAEMISRLLNCQHFPKATKQTVLSNLGGKDILHFSCHGYFDKAEPLSSGIILHGNNYEDEEKKFKYDVLSAREIFNLKERMDADLVTVSACQTGLSDRRPGDELVGLTRSLLYAGAASVVVSLWSVAANSTVELMEEFYSQLKEGKDKATALQQAMIKIMMKPEYSHPYFWAPFLLVGDWE
jgi:CHAT domain-containing protein/uncharacterized protein HemY